MKWLTSKISSSKSSAAWRPFFKVLEISWGLSTTAPKSLFSGVLNTVSFTFSSTRVRNFLDIIVFNIWEYFWNFMNQHKDVPDLVLSTGELLEGVNCLRPKLLQQPFRAVNLAIQRTFYIYYPVSCFAWFPVFKDTHKGLFCTCIKDNAEGVASALVLEWCHDSLMHSCRSEVVVFVRFDRIWYLKA